jgi:hypothetical protein
VSSAIFSRQWARLLTQAAVERTPNLYESAEFQEWLAGLRQEWLAEINIPALGWSQKQKLQQVGGAFATLLWIELYPLETLAEDQTAAPGPAPFRLRSFALGDSCLFHLRDGQFLKSFPIETAAEFELDPQSLCSANLNRDHLLEFKAIDEECRAGDLLVLCTDAVAKWAMTLYEAGQAPVWDAYWTLAEEDWRDEISGLRRAGLMRYDDTTLVLVRVGPPRVELREDAPEEPAFNLGDSLVAGQMRDLTPTDPGSREPPDIDPGAFELSPAEKGTIEPEPAGTGTIDLEPVEAGTVELPPVEAGTIELQPVEPAADVEPGAAIDPAKSDHPAAEADQVPNSYVQPNS